MTKASIVEDAISYIGELQKTVQNLTEKLHEMEETPLEIDEQQQTDQVIKPEVETINLKEEMKKMGIEVFFNKNLNRSLIHFFHLS